MPLSNQEKKHLKAIGHHLKPVLILGDKGLTDSLLEELNLRLEDHELIKVKIASEDREERQLITNALCEASGAELVQSIGKIALIYRTARKPNPKLSNILRFDH